MDFFFKGVNVDTSECPFDELDIQKCPFLRNINKPTSFSFSTANISIPVPVSLFWVLYTFPKLFPLSFPSHMLELLYDMAIEFPCCLL